MIKVESVKRAFLAQFGIFPYVVVRRLILLIFTSKKNEIYIWTRNSYELGYIEPGYSDLDITIYCTNSLNQEIAYNTKKKIENLKSFFPLIGEINCYLSEDIDRISHHFNYFEVLRDPTLLKHFSKIDRKNIRAQAIVFIIKQLESDISMLNNFSGRRIKKWNYIYNAVAVEIPEADLKNKIPFNKEKILNTMICIILHLIKIYSYDDFQNLYKKIDFYFLLRLKNVDLHKLPNILCNDTLFFLFLFDKIPNIELGMNNFSSIEFDILAEKINWETIGCYTQKTSNRFDQFQVLHLKNIYTQVVKVDSQKSCSNLNVALSFLSDSIGPK